MCPQGLYYPLVRRRAEEKGAMAERKAFCGRRITHTIRSRFEETPVAGGRQTVGNQIANPEVFITTPPPPHSSRALTSISRTYVASLPYPLPRFFNIVYSFYFWLVFQNTSLSHTVNRHLVLRLIDTVLYTYVNNC